MNADRLLVPALSTDQFPLELFDPSQLKFGVRERTFADRQFVGDQRPLQLSRSVKGDTFRGVQAMILPWVLLDAAFDQLRNLIERAHLGIQ